MRVRVLPPERKCVGRQEARHFSAKEAHAGSTPAPRSYAPEIQLEWVTDFYSVCCGFKSLQEHQAFEAAQEAAPSS